MPKYPKRSFISTKDHRCGFYVQHNDNQVQIKLGPKDVWYNHDQVYQVLDFDLPVSKHLVYLDPSEGVPTLCGLNKEYAKGLKSVGC